jgi:enamine deaminase RidA (YjgF/YER057c/UK114 family)
VPAVRTGNLLFLSGHVPPAESAGVAPTGRVGDEIGIDEGYAAARRAALALIATLREEAGSLDRVTRIVKVFGMVNSSPGFAGLPEVIDGCSDLLIEVFGPLVGRHARSAVGMAALPGNAMVEIEMIVEVSDEPIWVEEGA